MSADEIGSPLTKKYSAASSEALKTMDSLESALKEVAARAGNLDKMIDPNNLDTMIAAKNELAQLIGDLEKLQFKRVCFGSVHFSPVLPHTFCRREAVRCRRDERIEHRRGRSSRASESFEWKSCQVA